MPDKANDVGAHPVRTTSIVIYATLLLLAFTIPQALSNWLKVFEPGAVQRTLLEGAFAVQSFSNRMGANWPYYEARRIFLNATGKRED